MLQEHTEFHSFEVICCYSKVRNCHSHINTIKICLASSPKLVSDSTNIYY